MATRTAPVFITRSGAAVRPWRVTCRSCRDERLHFTDAGAVVVNDRGIGNRTWALALLAALAHVAYHRDLEASDA